MTKSGTGGRTAIIVALVTAFSAIAVALINRAQQPPAALPRANVPSTGASSTERDEPTKLKPEIAPQDPSKQETQVEQRRSNVASVSRLSEVTLEVVSGDDGKDFDTILDITLSDISGNVLATGHSSGTPFLKKDIQSIPLKVVRSISPEGASNLHLRLKITPKGNDTWLFTPTLVLTWSDKSASRNIPFGSQKVSEDVPVAVMSN